MSFFYTIQKWIEKTVFPSVCSFLAIFKKKKPIDFEPKKILVIRLWALGEAVLVLPMLKALKESKPSMYITVLSTPKTKDVFIGQSFIDEVKVTYKTTNPIFLLSDFFDLLFSYRKHDLAIDTEPHFAASAIFSFWLAKRSIGYASQLARSKLYDILIEYNDHQHAVYTICDLIRPLQKLFVIKDNLLHPSELSPLPFNEVDKNKVDEFFNYQDITQKPFIGIHAFCGPSASYRAWPTEKFTELIDKIKEKYKCSIILTGFGKEKEGNDKIISTLKDKTSVFNITDLPTKSFFYLVKHFDLLISNDTGPMHVAAAQKVKTIGLFGPNTPVRFGPFPTDSKRNIALYKADKISAHIPKHPIINIHKGHIGICDGSCMRAITVDEVFDATCILLSSKQN